MTLVCLVSEIYLRSPLSGGPDVIVEGQGDHEYTHVYFSIHLGLFHVPGWGLGVNPENILLTGTTHRP